MKVITKVPLSILGDRVEAGTEIELKDELLSSIDANDYEVVGAEKVAEPEPEPEKDIDKMTLSELKAKAESLGLSTSGSKADLVERISLNGEQEA